jgi:hypothetical protein
VGAELYRDVGELCLRQWELCMYSLKCQLPPAGVVYLHPRPEETN